MANNKKISSASPIRYPGGKFRARKLLLDYIPEGTEKVYSPFLGGGSFELFLTENGIAVEGTDVFWVLSNFWEMLLSEPDALADKIQEKLGKVDRDIFHAAQSELIDLEYKHDGLTQEQLIDAATKFIIVNRCSFSGATLSGGFSKESAKTRFTQSNIDKIRGFHNPLFTAGYGDAFEKLQDIDKDVLLFLDPPYMLSDNASTLYGISGNLHKSFDHEKLYELVNKSGAEFVLTYNDCPEIREMWKDYRIDDAAWAYGMNKSKKSAEIVIYSDGIEKRNPQIKFCVGAIVL